MTNTYLENTVITILPNKAQKVNAPGVHQLIIGSARDTTCCFGYAWDYTFTVDLHTDGFNDNTLHGLPSTGII